METTVFFKSYSEFAGGVPVVGRVAGMDEPNHGNAKRFGVPRFRNEELNLKYFAALTGDSFYYQKLAELREAAAARREIMEKYPYDGKSTFAEFLKKELSE